MIFFRFLLFPFAILYDFITRIRNYFYDVGILKSTSFEIPVIAVGNLSVGGTGKTPQIEYLIRILQDEYTIAVLSRGYKRKTSGFIVVDTSHTAADVGDEPLQFFNKFSTISVAVDENRVHGIQELHKICTPDIILLDDAFQHRKVTAGFYLLLTNYNDLFLDDFLLPAGNLRESRSGAKRANSIVVTKCPQNLSKEKQNKLREKLTVSPNQQVFFSTINYHPKTLGSQEISINVLHEYEIVLVTGIANPTPLIDFLKDRHCIIHHIAFADHHHFTSQEIDKIKVKYDEITSDKKILLTTEKDYMRLADQISELSYLEIATEFLEGKERFMNEIKSFCRINS